MELKTWIIHQAREIGIDKIGFTHAHPFEEWRNPLLSQQENGHLSGFEHPALEERLNPALTFERPRTLIALALVYPSQTVRLNDGRPRGMFSRSSWGVDYHDLLREKMDLLIEKIRQRIRDARFMPMVDTGPLIDVATAHRAGLGFIGKNGLLITETFGSFVYLGEIVTDLDIEPDLPMDSQCGSCQKCIKACPGKALLGNGSMNAKRCLSYHTQTKGPMEMEFRKKIRNVLYGCDICQLVCPFNKGKHVLLHPKMEPDPYTIQPDLEELLTISNKEFNARFGHMAGSWRGKKNLQRNAIIALANLKSTASLPLLKKLANEESRPDILETYHWAIHELENPTS